MSEHQTEHFKINKPDPLKHISDEVYTLRDTLDLIDAIFKTHAMALEEAAVKTHRHVISDIEELQAALDSLMPKDQQIKLAELSDVFGVENARVNYILTKTALGFAFNSANSVLGEHIHELAEVNGLQAVLNTFLAGAVTSIDGEIPVFQGTSGKQIKNSGVTIASLRDGGTY